VNETAPSEDIYFDAFDKKTPSENIPNLTSAPVTSSAVVPAAFPTQTEAASNVVPPVLSIENGEAPQWPSTPKEKKPAPTTPPVYETAPSDILNPDAPVIASVASPAGTTSPVS
jgi:hypothetical protein